MNLVSFLFLFSLCITIRILKEKRNLPTPRTVQLIIKLNVNNTNIDGLLIHLVIFIKFLNIILN